MRCGYLVSAIQASDRSTGTSDKIGRPHEQADLVRGDPFREPRTHDATDGLRLLGSGCKGLHLRRRAVEDRNNAAPLVLGPVHVAHHGREQPVGSAADLLGRAVTDLERI